MAAKKIFIVDDDMLLATMLADHLRSIFRHQVMTFSTGEECLSRLKERPDLMILDYHLNSVENDAADGLRILEKIKKQDVHVHVIMLSSQAQ
jgi:two-component system, OmpR family, response regulator